MAFNENEEPKEVDIPGLASEGEKETLPAAQTSSITAPTSPKTFETLNTPSEQSDEPPAQSTTLNLTPEPLRRSSRSTQPVDYKLAGNPDARKPSTRLNSTLSTSYDPTRSTESSRAKSIQNERANLAVAHLWETLLEETELCYSAQENDIPRTPKEALAGPESKEWKDAMDEEHATLMGMETWKKGKLPEDQKVVGCRWVFTKKRDEHGKVIKYKA